MISSGYAQRPMPQAFVGGQPLAARAAAPTVLAVPQHAVPYQAPAQLAQYAPQLPTHRPQQMPMQVQLQTRQSQPQPQPRVANLRPIGAQPQPQQSSFVPPQHYAQPQQPQQPPAMQQPAVPVVVAGPPKPPPPADAATDQADHDLRPGDWVKLAVVAHNPDYQDKPFQVEQANCGDGRVMARFTHNGVVKKLYLEASALEKIDAAAHGLSTELPGNAAAPPTITTTPQPAQLSGTVRIINLGVRPEHNGKLAHVLQPGIPDASGRVKVQVEGTATVLDLPPSYLELVAPEAPCDTTALPDSATQVGGMRLNEHVQIHSLASRPHHNGRTGIVESLDAVNNTLVVALDHVGPDGVGRLALSPNYVKSLETPGDVAANPLMQQGGSAQAPQVEAAPAAAVAPAAAEASAVSALQPGDRVRVVNLGARPEYDGQTCVVQSIHDAATGEVVVGFEDPALAANMLLLGPDYLERC
eukprot:TRINITY_DN1143_c1_g1_i1.p1 TRINITY_DN1143_c1_g1~~TRINITY_DN1143_c1_g1_i1.p1  ORF type:complete len:471 (-),score=115.83 TRINITY_DN1143_c1_g1_i1:93-1505(-)